MISEPIMDEKVSICLSPVDDANVICAINRTKGRTLSDRVRNYLRSVTPAEGMPALAYVDRTVHNDEPARYSGRWRTSPKKQHHPQPEEVIYDC